jgi:uncharacterized protein
MQFRPYPIITIARIMLIAIALTVVLFLTREWIAGIFTSLLIAIWLVAIVYAGIAFIYSGFRTITIEGQTIAYKAGILSTKNVILPFSKITERGYDQTLFQRIFGVGNLRLDTAGGSTVAISVENIRYQDMKTIFAAVDGKTDK